MSLSKELLEEILGDGAYLVGISGANNAAMVSRYYICYKPEEYMMDKANKCVDHDWDDNYFFRMNNNSFRMNNDILQLSYCIRCGIPSSFKVGALVMYKDQTQVHLYEQMPELKYLYGAERPLLMPPGLSIELGEPYSIEAIRIFVKGLINIFISRTNYFKIYATVPDSSST